MEAGDQREEATVFGGKARLVTNLASAYVACQPQILNGKNAGLEHIRTCGLYEHRLEQSDELEPPDAELLNLCTASDFDPGNRLQRGYHRLMGPKLPLGDRSF